jgi:hypothetical protein
MCNPPTFRVTANDEQWVLTASADCLTCRGSGEVREAHGEVLDCDCCFDDAAPEVVAAIAAGAAYTIEPDPRWVAFMDQMYRSLRGGE